MKTCSIDLLRKLLDYDSETGALTWRARTPDMFEDGGHSAAHTCAKWNSRYAGGVAGGMLADGHIQVRIEAKFYKAHRVIWALMTGDWPKNEIDHKNCAPADNRWENLREATRSQNAKNMRKPKTNKSGAKGVYWHKAAQKWCVQVSADGMRLYCGVFEDFEAAVHEYRKIINEYNGEFARAE